MSEVPPGPASLREREFEALYRSDPDPWRMETSAYEAAKYDATLRALGRARYGTALEVGCSVGVLTARLAGRCDSVLALDVSGTALALARERPGTSNVEWRLSEVPGGWVRRSYDLIVLSEVLYFLEPHEVRALATLAARDLASGGEIVVVNWLGECDRTLTGDAASELFIREAKRSGFTVGQSWRTARYRIDRVQRIRCDAAPHLRSAHG